MTTVCPTLHSSRADHDVPDAADPLCWGISIAQAGAVEACACGIGVEGVEVNVSEAGDNKDKTKEVLWQVENP